MTFPCHPNYCSYHQAVVDEKINIYTNRCGFSIVAGGTAKITLPEPTAMDAFEAVVEAVQKYGDKFTATHALNAIHNMIQEYPIKHQVVIADGSSGRR